MSKAVPGQAHRHGVRKNLVEGIGGFLTGAALVLFLRRLVKGRAGVASQNPRNDSTTRTSSGESA